MTDPKVGVLANVLWCKKHSDIAGCNCDETTLLPALVVTREAWERQAGPQGMFWTENAHAAAVAAAVREAVERIEAAVVEAATANDIPMGPLRAAIRGGTP